MADAYSGTGSVSWDQPAWNRLLYFGFREVNVFDQIADVKSTAETNPGASVSFFIAQDIAPTSTTLNESVDVDAVAISDSNVTVNLFEKGLAVVETQLLRLTSMIPIDPAIANLLGQNSGESMELLAVDALSAGTNVFFASNAGTRAANRAALTVDHKIHSGDIRYARNRLRRGKVPKRDGLYNCHIDPDVLYDLREETGGLGWMESHKYTESGVGRIYDGELGIYEGFRFLETVNGKKYVNGVSTFDVYRTLFTGAQALAKGFSSADGYGPNPITVKGPVTDKLERFQPWGWKHFVGYKVFRQAAVWQLESISTVGDNAS